MVSTNLDEGDIVRRAPTEKKGKRTLSWTLPNSTKKKNFGPSSFWRTAIGCTGPKQVKPLCLGNFEFFTTLQSHSFCLGIFELLWGPSGPGGT